MQRDSHAAGTRVLLGFAVLALIGAEPAAAQAPAPEFALPETPYDYSARSPYKAAQLGSRWRDAGDEDLRFDDRATLGRVLFYDASLSRNRTRSCASCHEQARAFTDGQPFSTGFRGQRTKRSSMSIANLGQRTSGLFWDARVEWLEEMVLMPIQDPVEMGLDLPALIARLERATGYSELFERAFGDERIDAARIAAALAEFVRAVVSLRSRYDEGLAIAGDPLAEFTAFTAAENRGKGLFFHHCADCHLRRTQVGGDAHSFDPHGFDSGELVNNGVDGGRRKDDPGRAGVTGVEADRGRFRAPTLRNIELTAPYMHDGRFATLEKVLGFYARGVRRHPALDPRMRSGWGGGSAGANVPGITSAVSLGLRLSSREQADLVAFMKTLTDRELTRDPRFADPFAPAAHR